MTKYKETSDYHIADNAEQVAPGRGPKWRPVFRVAPARFVGDPDAGKVCGRVEWLDPTAMTGAQWMQHMRDTRDRYPLPTGAIVLPDGWGWVVDEDGAGISAVHLKQWAATQPLEAAA